MRGKEQRFKVTEHTATTGKAKKGVAATAPPDGNQLAHLKLFLGRFCGHRKKSR